MFYSDFYSLICSFTVLFSIVFSVPGFREIWRIYDTYYLLKIVRLILNVLHLASIHGAYLSRFIMISHDRGYGATMGGTRILRFELGAK